MGGAWDGLRGGVAVCIRLFPSVCSSGPRPPNESGFPGRWGWGVNRDHVSHRLEVRSRSLHDPCPRKSTYLRIRRWGEPLACRSLLPPKPFNPNPPPRGFRIAAYGGVQPVEAGHSHTPPPMIAKKKHQIAKNKLRFGGMAG